jgi:hypothetical protein
MDLSPKNLGRGGGIVLAIVGLLLTVVAFGMMSSGQSTGTIRLAVLMLGLALALIGVLAWRAAPKGPEQVMTREAALAELASHPLPFWICARCHAVMERNFGTGCTECGSTVDCLEVSTEADRKTATAAMS